MKPAIVSSGVGDGHMRAMNHESRVRSLGANDCTPATEPPAFSAADHIAAGTVVGYRFARDLAAFLRRERGVAGRVNKRPSRSSANVIATLSARPNAAAY